MRFPLLLSLPAALLCLAGGCDRYDASLQQAIFAIETGSAHEQVSCIGCHASDPPDAWLTGCAQAPAVWDGGCIGCHACDRDQLHPAGSAHGNGLSCASGASCHSVADRTWGDATGVGPGTTEVTQLGPCSGACHGNARGDDAPLDASHAAHLDPSELWRVPDGCTSCHPAGGSGASTHADGIVDLPFGGLGLDPLGGVPSSYSAGTCTVYCHGSTLPEGGAQPTWNGGSAEAGCGTCHGWPPGLAHPTGETCSLCHATGGDLQQIGSSILHLDGEIQ